MNCKPGDLAVIVQDEYGHHEGKVVLVVRRSPVIADGWVVTPELRDLEGWDCHPCDKHLRPIRPGDISDEEVRDLYAPKLPEGIAA